MSEQTSAVTAVIVAPPTTNGPLHIGHLAGPYIAGDVIARAVRDRGERVVNVNGIDTHPNWVLTRAENEDVDVQKVILEYRERIDEAMRRARVECDEYLDPEDSDHQAAIVRLANHVVDFSFPLCDYTLLACSDCGRTLHNSYVEGTCSRCGAHSHGGTCEGCGGFASAQTLVEPQCGRCGGAPTPFTARIPVLVLEDFRDQLTEIWLHMEQPRRMRELIHGYLRDGLPELPLAFPTNYGVVGAGTLAGLRLDVNFELGLNGYQCVARGIDPAVDGVEAAQAAWRQVGKAWHVHGIDNGFYSAVLWPLLWAALGVRPEQHGGSIVNEFYTLDGAKFSTSRNHAIWADELLAAEDPEIVRLYLAWDGPDRYASDFTMAGFVAFRDRVAPLLAGRTSGDPLPTPLASASLTRGLQALRPERFDLALAARCLLEGLEGIDGAERLPEAERLRAILAGTRG